MSITKVVKGLICCTNWKDIIDCSECPYHHPTELCGNKLMKDALALIDELQAVIESESAAHDAEIAEKLECHRLANVGRVAAEENIKKANAQIENLEKTNKYLRERLQEEMEHAEDMKPTAIVEKMKEKLKATFCPDATYCGYDIHGAINEKAKEILEETK